VGCGNVKLFDSRSRCHLRSGFRGSFIVCPMARCDNVFLRAVLPTSDAGIFIRTLDHPIPIIEGFRGGVSSATQYGHPPRRNGQAILGRIPFDGARFQPGSWLRCRCTLRGSEPAVTPIFELLDEKVLFLTLLSRDFGLWSMLSSARHDSSLTGTVWVPRVRRYRRKSVAAPKFRQLDFRDCVRSFKEQRERSDLST
jgi:hypothetical protein